MSLSLLMSLLKSDSSSLLGLNLLSNLTPKLVVTSFLSFYLIIIPSTTSFVVYNKLSSLLLTLIIDSLSLLIIARFSIVLVRIHIVSNKNSKVCQKRRSKGVANQGSITLYSFSISLYFSISLFPSELKIEGTGQKPIGQYNR